MCFFVILEPFDASYRQGIILEMKRGKSKVTTIYLAELVHNYASRGPHTFPVNKKHNKALTKLYNQFKCVDVNQTLRKMVEYMDEKDLFYSVEYA